ncbi:MAG: PadR family transcriptional regulator [Sphingobacteriaceae bacterium]|nr:MAG: PadR family transcriptional regulator [Sphingobacteriaceae bacterium]
MNSSSLLKGTLQTIILKLLENKAEMYGYEITQKVKEISSGKIVLTQGALYPALHRLEAEGLLESYTQTVDNRVRKYYRLTTEGQSGVKEQLKEAQDFISQLQLILNLKTNLA